MTSSMLRGFLQIVVLKALAEGQKSGYALMQFVAARVGVKPSPGSIYPLLDELKKKGVVTVKGVGRKKEYLLTITGKKHLASVEQKRNECLCNLVNGMKILSALTGEDTRFPQMIVEGIKRGEFPFKEINPEWDQLRDSVFTMMKQGRFHNQRHAVRKILAQAIKGLRSL